MLRLGDTLDGLRVWTVWVRERPYRNNVMPKPASYRAPTYAFFIPYLTEIAREHGYAIGVHGSLNRDLDLVAVPWIEDAGTPEELIEALRVGVRGTVLPTGTKAGRYDPDTGQFVDSIIENPSRKPHGRLAWNIHMDNGFFIDISVIPPIAR